MPTAPIVKSQVYVQPQLMSHNNNLLYDQVGLSHCALLLFQGLMGHDRVLAGALWRTFFDKACEDPVKLELMVQYVRKQVSFEFQISAHLLLDYKAHLQSCFYIKL